MPERRGLFGYNYIVLSLKPYLELYMHRRFFEGLLSFLVHYKNTFNILAHEFLSRSSAFGNLTGIFSKLCD